MVRTKGYLWIGIVYVAAFFVALGVAYWAPFESLILRVLLADLAATAFVYVFSCLLRNSSVYDPYWSVAPLVMAVFFVERLNPATVLMLVVLFFWGIRLTLNWAYTFKGLHAEDWRYGYFRKRFPRAWPLVNLFGIHLMPTMVVFLAMLPVFLFLQNAETISAVVAFGALMSLSAAFVQLVADTQMHKFRARGEKGVNDAGLWRYSRHPNYFGEILMWFGVYVMMLGAVDGYVYAGIGAVLNLAMFLTISIPLMEKRLLARKADYAEYVKTTSPLLPLPRKDPQKQEAN